MGSDPSPGSLPHPPEGQTQVPGQPARGHSREQRKLLFPLVLGWLSQCDTFTNVGEKAVGPQDEENAFASFGDGVKDREHFSPRVMPSDLVLTSVLGFGAITGLSPGQGSRDSSWPRAARQEKARGSCDSGCYLETWHP